MIEPPAIDDQVGRYQILSELGRGSMGCVYLAEDPHIERRVALKVFCPQGVDPDMEEDLEKRFVTEAKAAGRLSHPGIVTIYDAGRDAGHSYIAMEWVEGATLEDILDRKTSLHPTTAIRYAAQIARALDYAHDEGVVHRDIKPANVLVREDGRVQVMDFGIAKLGTQSMTLAGAILGTPTFMSPEQISSKPVDGRSDLFSLGTLLHLCLTGRNPFQANSIPAVADRIAHLQAPAVFTVEPSIPESLSDVVDRALRKLPEERFQTGNEFADALELASLDLTGLELTTASTPDDVLHRLDDLQDLEDMPSFDATVLAADTPRAEPASPRLYANSSRPSERLVAAIVALLLLVVSLWIFRSAGSDPETTTAAALDATGIAPQDPLVAPEVKPSSPPLSPQSSSPQPSAPQPSAPQPSAPPPAPAADATVQLVYANKLRQGTITVQLDGQPSWSNSLSATTLRRTIEHLSLKLTPGRHSIMVQIVKPPDIDVTQSIKFSVKSKEQRQLQVSLKKRSKELSLEWITPD